jgi:hypothetical protein
MAYVNQEKKKELAPAIKAVFKKHGVKGTLAVKHYSTLVANIKEGVIPFDADKSHRQINQYNYEKHHKDNPKLVAFLDDLIPAMEGENFFNHDDPMTDYFHRSHYIDINMGQWNKPYKVIS